MAWSDVLDNNNNNGSDKVGYVKFEEDKAVTLRILDEEPTSKWRHWIANANNGEGKKKGRSIVCSGKDCPVCEAIRKAKKAGIQPEYNSTMRHTIHVLNLDSNTIELLEQGKTFFKNLLTYQKAMGDLRDFDIKIIRSGRGTNTSYTIIPGEKKPLTEEQIAMYKSNKVDLEERLKPYTIEQTLAIMEGKDPSEVFNNDDEENEEIEI